MSCSDFKYIEVLLTNLENHFAIIKYVLLSVYLVLVVLFNDR